MDTEQFRIALLNMIIPHARRDTDKPENVRWLIRNLAIYNEGHPDFDAVMLRLKALDKLDSVIGLIENNGELPDSFLANSIKLLDTLED